MIKKDTVVAIGYTLKNDSGETLDEATHQEPLFYLHGSSQIIPGLEAALEGSKAGDKKQVRIEPKDAYGERADDLILTLHRTQFPKDAKIEEGMQFMGTSDDGKQAVFTVLEINGDAIEVDGNHPLSGETLNFDVEVISVREATKEELEHGHAHGPGGHH